MKVLNKNEIARTAWSFYFGATNSHCPSCKNEHADTITDELVTAPYRECHGGDCVVRDCGFCGAIWSYQTPNQYKAGHNEEISPERLERLVKLNVGVPALLQAGVVTADRVAEILRG